MKLPSTRYNIYLVLYLSISSQPCWYSISFTPPFLNGWNNSLAGISSALLFRHGWNHSHPGILFSHSFLHEWNHSLPGILFTKIQDLKFPNLWYCASFILASIHSNCFGTYNTLCILNSVKSHIFVWILCGFVWLWVLYLVHRLTNFILDSGVEVWMADPRQRQPNGSIHTSFWLLLIPWINMLWPNYIGANTWRDLGFWHPR